MSRRFGARWSLQLPSSTAIGFTRTDSYIVRDNLALHALARRAVRRLSQAGVSRTQLIYGREQCRKNQNKVSCSTRHDHFLCPVFLATGRTFDGSFPLGLAVAPRSEGSAQTNPSCLAERSP